MKYLSPHPLPAASTSPVNWRGDRITYAIKPNRSTTLLSSGQILFELLIVISLTCVMFAAPNFLPVKSNYDAQTLHQLITIINTARQYALATKQVVTLCPSDNGYDCSNNWNHALIIKNRAQQLLLQQKVLLKSSDYLTANFFREQFLQFLPDGTTNSTNGRLILNSKYLVILNKYGRVYSQ